MSDPSLVRFRVAVQGALAHLESRRQEINDLNVFPVADGDTGDNMALTLRAVLTELDRLEGDTDERSIDEIGRTEIVEAVARAALLGARGNSGVILSQLIRGAAEELVSRPGELVDPVLLGAAFANAANRAYASVQAPAEGTMLTVMRDMATSIAHDLAHLPEEARRLAGEADVETQNALIAAALERAIVAGEASVKRGPELLPALREAGVVDAGGYGVIIIFAGIVAALKGTAPELQHYAPAARVTHPEHASETYRYCTNFAVTGTGLEAGRFVPQLEAFGDSILVVGDHATLKVHVHTDEPEKATELFASAGGEVSRLDVADMRAQVIEREARLSAVGSDGNGAGAGAAVATDGEVVIEQCCGALAIVTGAGLHALFEGLGATVLDGGPTLNPSTMEILAGIHQVPAEEVVVLPNSSNVFMAAERAAELSDKKVVVVKSRSQQAGLSAAFALNADRSAAENATAMDETLEAVRTGGVAPAARQDPEGRFAIGDAVGYVGEDLVAWGEPSKTLQIVLGQLSADAELVTCIEGQGAPLDGDAVAALAPAGVELELEDGGQPSWWWLLAAE
jgi:DAK2 domain fusion protein YloV